MPATDVDILQKAFAIERRSSGGHLRGWTWWSVGAGSAKRITKLVEDGLVEIVWKSEGTTAYKLSEKGRGVVAVSEMERQALAIPATDMMDGLRLIKGFDDLKASIALTMERQRRVHYLLEGPPACAKTLFLMGVQTVVGLDKSYLSFGSRTSAAGLSEVLFTTQPQVLLMDEIDKMPQDAFSVLLGLMESGDVVETKSRSVRGVKLATVVLAACNDSSRLPPEFLSRFALHARFPAYTRQEFIDVAQHLLGLTEGVEVEMAREIGAAVFDRRLGDIRKVRAVWDLMEEPTKASMAATLALMERYGPQQERRKPMPAVSTLPGLE